MSDVEEQITNGAVLLKAITDGKRLLEVRKELSIDGFFHYLGKN